MKNKKIYIIILALVVICSMIAFFIKDDKEVLIDNSSVEASDIISDKDTCPVPNKNVDKEGLNEDEFYIMDDVIYSYDDVVQILENSQLTKDDFDVYNESIYFIEWDDNQGHSKTTYLKSPGTYYLIGFYPKGAPGLVKQLYYKSLDIGEPFGGAECVSVEEVKTQEFIKTINN